MKSHVSMAPINFDTSNHSSNSKIEPDSVSVTSFKIKKKPPIAPKKFFKEILANCNNDNSEGTQQRSSKNADVIFSIKIRMTAIVMYKTRFIDFCLWSWGDTFGLALILGIEVLSCFQNKTLKGALRSSQNNRFLSTFSSGSTFF